MNTIQKPSIFIVLVIGLLTFGTAPVSAEEPLKQQIMVDQARLVVDSFAVDPNMASYRGYLRRAKAVLIIPGLYKGAFFIGGSGGRGVLVARAEGTDEWFGPAFYTTVSVSLGIQFGGEKSEVILLVMTQKGLQSLYSTSFKLGADVSVAVGPIGAGAQSATAPSLKVDFISYSRAKGVFLGLSLDGAMIKENYDWNKAYYGKPVRPRNIIVAHDAINPNSDLLRAAVAKASTAE
jgi:lipid-binding SYLF domain-containing protein